MAKRVWGKPSPEEQYGAWRVLLVEDHAPQHVFLCALLQRLGIDKIDVAPTPESALQCLREHVYDLMIVEPAIGSHQRISTDLLTGVCELSALPPLILHSALPAPVVNSAACLLQHSGRTVVGRLPKPATLQGLRSLIETSAAATLDDMPADDSTASVF